MHTDISIHSLLQSCKQYPETAISLNCVRGADLIIVSRVQGLAQLCLLVSVSDGIRVASVQRLVVKRLAFSVL